MVEDPQMIEEQYRQVRKDEGTTAAVLFLRSKRALWPTAPRLACLYHALSGDLAQEIAEPTSRKMRQAAARNLKKLLPKVKDKALRSLIRNEIYFHRRQFNRQRLLGVEDVRRGDSKGNFSIGVGAWAQGELLIRRGHVTKAYRLARTADAAWTSLIASGASRQDVFAFAGMTKLLLGDEAGAKALFERTRQACPTPKVLEDYATDEVIVRSFKRCIGLLPPGPIN